MVLKPTTETLQLGWSLRSSNGSSDGRTTATGSELTLEILRPNPQGNKTQADPYLWGVLVGMHPKCYPSLLPGALLRQREKTPEWTQGCQEGFLVSAAGVRAATSQHPGGAERST